MKKVQDYNKWYYVLRHYADITLFQSYREIEYVGLEKIPEDGAIIIAPNHTNALMDALIVLSYSPEAKVFVARADIFKNPKLSKILHFLKIMPIMRIRDGISEVKKNDETIEKSVEVLMDKVPFCILPEGRHRAQHSLLPLGKGIFRIALQAHEVIGDKMPLYIIPYGIEYGNFFRFRSSVLVQIGTPINVGTFLSEHPDKTQPEIMNLMKEDLSEKLKEVILYIPDDQWYNATYELCSIVINEQIKSYIKENPKTKKRKKSTFYKANCKTVKELEALREDHPQIASTILEMAEEIYQLRTKEKISLSSVIIHYPFWNRLLKNLIFLISLPYIIFCSIIVLPISSLSRFLFKKMKDTAFFNSVRFVITLFLWPILLLIYAIIFFSVFPWPWAVFIMAASIPANIIAQDSFRLLRLMISDIKLMSNKPLRTKIVKLRHFFLSFNDLK
jgi:1-acyl-sn-glycerol-3-phosphate acyltransferase